MIELHRLTPLSTSFIPTSAILLWELYESDDCIIGMYTTRHSTITMADHKWHYDDWQNHGWQATISRTHTLTITCCSDRWPYNFTLAGWQTTSDGRTHAYQDGRQSHKEASRRQAETSTRGRQCMITILAMHDYNFGDTRPQAK